MTTRQTIKRLLSPIQYTRLGRGLSFFEKTRTGFKSIAIIHIGLFIITAIEAKQEDVLFFWLYCLIGLYVISYVVEFIGERAEERSDGYMILGLKRKYLNEYLHLENTAVEKIGTGKMQEIIFAGIDKRFTIVQDLVSNIFVQVISIIYAFTLIALQSPTRRYFGGLIVLFVVSALLLAKSITILHNTGKASKLLYGDLHRQEIKLLMHKFEVLQNNQFDNELQKIESISRTIKNLRISGNFKKSLWQLCGSVLVDGSEVILYGIAGIAVISGNFTLASLILLLNLLRTIGDRIRDIRTKSMMFSKAFVHVIKLRETFDTLPRISSLSEKSACTITKGNINLSNICFGYEEGKTNLSDFNLSLAPGSVTALVGPSGGGKSTIMKIIAGFINPQFGSVIIDDQEIHEYYLPSYYRYIGYLMQEPSVFDGTIRENLEYGMGDVGAINDRPHDQSNETGECERTDKNPSLRDVLEKSQCQFVYDLPKGLDTEIGERGVRLSGGQRQRLAIAKIMLKNPKIILLDEPTSALDSVSEELVSQAMQELFKDRTVVIIAHRLQTVKHADRILYIEDGAIAEEGTHEELIAQGGKYAKMVEVQTGF